MNTFYLEHEPAGKFKLLVNASAFLIINVRSVAV